MASSAAAQRRISFARRAESLVERVICLGRIVEVEIVQDKKSALRDPPHLQR